MVDFSKYTAEWVGLEEINAADDVFQCRAKADEKAIEAMVGSLEDEGQLCPIDIWGPGSDGKWRIINGHTRYEAAKRLKWEKCSARKVPGSELDEKAAYKAAVVMNSQQNSLKETDIMTDCWRLYRDGETISALSRDLKRERRIIREYIIIAKAGYEVQNAVKDGVVSARNTVAYLTENTPSGQGGGTMSQGGSEAEENIAINAENTKRLIEAIKSDDPKKNVKNLLGGDGISGPGNAYVKLTGKALEARLKVELIPENADAIDQFIRQVKEKWKEGIKQKGKGKTKLQIQRPDRKALEVAAKTTEEIGKLIADSAAKAKEDSVERVEDSMATAKEKATTGDWKPVSGSGNGPAAAGRLDSLKFLPKDMLLQYKAALDSGNSEVLEATFRSQGFTADQFRAAVESALKQQGK